MNKALNDNIKAVIELTTALSTTLGPNGMNKLLIDKINDIHVTKSSSEIISKIEIKHPIAKIISETSLMMNKEYGDGSTKTAVLTGELLIKATELINQGLSIPAIIKGYEKALNESIKIIEKNTIKSEIKEIIQTITNNEHLTTELIKALSYASPENIKVIKKIGKEINETKTIKGVIIDKERVHERMPKELKNAKVIITKTPIEIRKTENNNELLIRNPSQLSQFLKMEEQELMNIVNSIKESEANAVFCQKGIDDRAQEQLAREGIMAVRRVREDDINRLLKITNAQLINDLKTIRTEDLGIAELIHEEKIGSDNLTIIKNSSGNAGTIIVRASNNQALDEIERIINNSLKSATKNKNNALAGAGMIESIISKELMKTKIKGRESISYDAFASTLMKIPEHLTRNAGKKWIELKPSLINEPKGISLNGELINSASKGIIELKEKVIQELTSAFETARLILRIDGILKGK